MTDTAMVAQQSTDTGAADNALAQTIGRVAGFQAAGVASGIRKSERLDLALIASETPCTAAGVFTTNLVKAAPVLLDQAHLAHSANGIRAVVVNSGVANACTGEQGFTDAAETAACVADTLGCATPDVLVMSTGVIGIPLPMDKIRAGITTAADALQPEGWADAARAIMTTDTRPKCAALVVETPGGPVTIAGIAKGSGMIAPNMATMLAVIATDAALEAPLLQGALQAANAVSFNQIVVDGDMSTNDSVVVLANGAAGVTVEAGPALDAFTEGLTAVCTALAKGLVRDGEGASRFITLHITGAADEESARQVAMTIATSPLVKTAFYGGDANWGRILAAAGRAGVPLDADKLGLWFAAGEKSAAIGEPSAASNGGSGAVQLVANGTPTDYREADAAATMSDEASTVRLDLGRGAATATVWTCDLSHEYVTINGHYRT